MTEIKRLEWLDAITLMDVQNGLTALATKHFINRQFYGIPEKDRTKIFRTNVANNILFQANESLIETSIVAIVETLKAEDKIEKLPLTLPDLEELRKHRVILSHPGNVKFNDSKVQEFYDDKGHYKDPTAIRLWRIRESFIYELKARNVTAKFPNEVRAQLGTVELIHSVINLSLAKGHGFFSYEDTAESVYKYFAEYQKVLERN